ncbi:flagellar protein FlhE [Litchfieldella qijiaojingensis]|uniref:flagellar protein FlhE n=1 Tax=Litchfieldella qijiaojingensis TaxID=980347 RepID=UPI00167B01B1
MMSTTRLVVVLALLMLTTWPAWAASGSWVASAPSLRVAVPEREVGSQAMSATSSLPAQSRITSVRWRFDAPPGHPLRAWLCHPVRCIPLSSASGHSLALADLPASMPLNFRFRLPRGTRPLEVKGLQVIVDYR